MSRRTAVIIISLLAIAGFLAAAFIYKGKEPAPEVAVPVQSTSALLRFNAPSFGPAKAPVTIVEFFDPSCESCRAFYPIVKQMMAKHPEDVRLVLRYVRLHVGSEEAIRLLEAARKQGVFAPVLEAVLESQPQWHDDATAAAAWEAAALAGLDVDKARSHMMSPDIIAAIERDTQDAKTLGVKGTPTFFVNGKPLLSFGAQPLYDLIRSEISQSR
ncbi:TPA: DsbA family protein [Pseudomonas putida]|jgi:protein-disulfide isomerase|nr:MULTISPECIES: thioredoxin domain-containing protein [Pseudomonas]ATP52067.1 disulfide bond formation protein DsbA [Pseudomonas putida]AUY34156.1 disulfide bond formation protein DsbA [Pseudomonas sp. PONIH3]MCC9008500.1 thioredoxin domain-containing protein [Pseudomonas putida]MCO1623828.1 thioredoxin domain-containing protein [Pseudomonas putida]NSX22154.1 thioredoxin domain-containing protein [Pseudomonas putida]